MASKIKVDQIQTADGSGTIALQNQLSGMTTASLPTVTTDKLGTGAVLQVVSANITSEVATTSTSWVASPMAATITPSSSSSKIYISYNGFAYHYINEQAASTIYRGSTELSGKDGGFMRSWNSNGRGFFPHIANYLDSPNTTSATTYTVYVKKQSGTESMDFPSSSSSTVPTITLMEIAG